MFLTLSCWTRSSAKMPIHNVAAVCTPSMTQATLVSACRGISRPGTPHSPNTHTSFVLVCVWRYNQAFKYRLTHLQGGTDPLYGLPTWESAGDLLELLQSQLAECDMWVMLSFNRSIWDEVNKLSTCQSQDSTVCFLRGFTFNSHNFKSGN